MKPLETVRDLEAFAVHAVGPFGFVSTGAGVMIHQYSCRWADVTIFRSLATYGDWTVALA